MIKQPLHISGFDYTKLPYADLIATLLPTKWTRYDLGVCSDGINHVYGISLGELTAKPMIFIEGSIHGGHEWRCAYWVCKFAEMLTDDASIISPLAQKLRAMFSFYFIPCLNPYGYTSGKYWNANGVNLNRNFPCFWDEFDDSGQLWTKGASAGSEPETQMVMSLINQYKPIGFVDCHTWGGYNDLAIEPSRATYATLFNNSAYLQTIKTGKDKHVTYTGNDPRSARWVSTVISEAGIEPLSCAIEPGSLETENEQARLGVNFLLIFCCYVMEYYKRRIQNP